MGNNLKFYTQNKIDRNAAFSFTSATESLAKYLYDNNYNLRLVSSGSDDTTVENFDITFSSPQTADALFIGYHNFNVFFVTYSDDNQSTWKNFSPSIGSADCSDNYNYYEFTEVSGITDIRIQGYKTQVANDEKVLGQARLMSLLGEVSANPYNVDPTYGESSYIHSKSNGGATYVQFGRKMSLKLDFDDATEADVTLFRTLKDRFAPSFVYLNGGDDTITQEPFRVQDMFLCNYTNPFKPRPRKGFLIGAGTEISLNLQEV